MYIQCLELTWSLWMCPKHVLLTRQRLSLAALREAITFGAQGGARGGEGGQGGDKGGQGGMIRIT